MENLLYFKVSDEGIFYNKFNILNEIEFTDWAPRDLLLWIQSSTVQSRSISYSCFMRSVYVQFRKIWFGSRNISIFKLYNIIFWELILRSRWLQRRRRHGWISILLLQLLSTWAWNMRKSKQTGFWNPCRNYFKSCQPDLFTGTVAFEKSSFSVFKSFTP